MGPFPLLKFLKTLFHLQIKNLDLFILLQNLERVIELPFHFCS